MTPAEVRLALGPPPSDQVLRDGKRQFWFCSQGPLEPRRAVVFGDGRVARVEGQPGT